MAEYRSLMPFGRGGLLRGGPDPFGDFRKEMDRLVDDLGRGWTTQRAGEGKAFLIPRVDIAETDKGLELTAELPGFDEKDVSLDIHEGMLTIRAEHKEEREDKDEKKHYHLVERGQGSFLRRFALPFEADADRATAQLQKGLLKITVPRLATEGKKPKPIPVGMPSR